MEKRVIPKFTYSSSQGCPVVGNNNIRHLKNSLLVPVAKKSHF
jgi:hypothetical protein